MECMAMSQRYLRGFTASEKTELWDRWQRGESLKAIGRAFGKPSSSIYCQVAPHGGIRPAPRRRSRLALTASEREEISRGIAAHQSARSMARLLGHSPSTVSREISRNGGYDRYRAALADEKAALGDKGYDSKLNREAARQRGICPAIPYRSKTKDMPIFFPKAVYKTRARIEQAVGNLERFKRIALRCEKTAQNYGSFVALALGFILIKSVHTA